MTTSASQKWYALQCCCTQPKTGFYRDGYCNTGPQDAGAHVVCSKVTKDFLEFSAGRGNDLRSILSPGDRCAL
jgi:uncharacterized protein